MVCELVTVVALTWTDTAARARPLPRVCLTTLIRRARRERAVIIDMRNGKNGKVLLVTGGARK